MLYNDKLILDDYSLVKLAKEGDSEAISILSSRHSGVYFLNANKFINLTSGTMAQDIRENQDFVVWKAAESYKEEKGVQFNSWLGLVTKFQCCDILENSRFNEIPLEPQVFEDVADIHATKEHIKSELDKTENHDNINFIYEVLDQIKNKDVRAAIEERFCKGRVKTYREAGAKLGISGQAVKNRETLFINLVRSKMGSAACCDLV